MDSSAWTAVIFSAFIALSYANFLRMANKEAREAYNLTWWRERVEDPRSFSEGVLAEQMVEFYESELGDKR